MKKFAIMTDNLGGSGVGRVASTIITYINNPKMPIILVKDSIERDYCGKIVVLPKWYDLRGRAKSKLGRKIISKLSLPINTIEQMRILFISRYKKRHHIDVAMSMTFKTNVYNLLSNKVGKTVISVHSYWSVAGCGELAEAVIINEAETEKMKRLYKKADFIIAISEPIKDKLISDFGINPGNVKVIYNPVDVAGICKQSLYNIPEEHKHLFYGTVFITIGTLGMMKGHHHAIRAFSEVKKAVSDTRLIIIGRGSSRKELEVLIEELGLNDSITILDFQSNPYMYMKNSSVYVGASLVEGFPNALVEAMVCGLPVISSDCLSGPREILAPGSSYGQKLADFKFEEYGILCPVCDGIKRNADIPLTDEERILANAMITLARDRDCREEYKEKGLLRVQEFDVAKVIPKYLEVLESV